MLGILHVRIITKRRYIEECLLLIYIMFSENSEIKFVQFVLNANYFSFLYMFQIHENKSINN